MIPGDVLKYMPTATVGKVTDIRERDGIVWVKLDFTNLYYDQRFLVPADASEYKAVSFKGRERTLDEKMSRQTIKDFQKMEAEADVADFTPTGGG